MFYFIKNSIDTYCPARPHHERERGREDVCVERERERGCVCREREGERMCV